MKMWLRNQKSPAISRWSLPAYKQASRLESKESMETDSEHVNAVPKTQRSENVGDSRING